MGGEVRVQDGTWKVQYDRNVSLGSVPGTEAKALPSHRTLLRKGNVQPR